MDILYAPWRDAYVADHKNNKKKEGQCVFCEKFATDKAAVASEFILKKTDHAYVILNLYPYNGGHLLIIPAEHIANLEDLSKKVRDELMDLVSHSVKVVKDVLQAQGVNVGLNLGRASGAGIPDHLHWHVVPRWAGDTSFITTVGKTKNVSVDLHRIYKDLQPAFQKI